MGICNVLAVIPFLCSAPPEEPPQDEQVIQSSPAPEVEMTTLTPPAGTAVAPPPEAAPAPSMRRVSDYEVLPPSSAPDVGLRPSQTGTAAPADEDVDSFSEWVNRNWREEREDE